MYQFMVPQFIEVEDKILGPITTRQFVELLAGGLICFIMYRFLSFTYFAIGAVLIIGVDVVLAFARVNGRPVHYFLLNFLQTAKRPKLRIWNRESFVRHVHEVESGLQEKPKEVAKKAPVSGSRLRDLAIVVNTGGVYQGEEIVNESYNQ